MVHARYLYAELEMLHTGSISPGFRITTGYFTYFSKMSLTCFLGGFFGEYIHQLFLFTETINVKVMQNTCRVTW